MNANVSFFLIISLTRCLVSFERKIGISASSISRMLKGLESTEKQTVKPETAETIQTQLVQQNPVEILPQGSWITSQFKKELQAVVSKKDRIHVYAWLRNVEKYNELLAKEQRNLSRTSTSLSSNPFLDKKQQIMQEMKGIMSSESNLTKHDIQTIIRNEVRKATQKDSAIDQAIKIVVLLKGSGENKSATQIITEIVGVVEGLRNLTPKKPTGHSTKKPALK